MKMETDYNVQDIVQLKKEHPCKMKTNLFKILQIDGEVRLKCQSCGGIILLKRSAFEKALKKIVLKSSN